MGQVARVCLDAETAAMVRVFMEEHDLSTMSAAMRRMVRERWQLMGRGPVVVDLVRASGHAAPPSLRLVGGDGGLGGVGSA